MHTKNIVKPIHSCCWRELDYEYIHLFFSIKIHKIKFGGRLSSRCGEDYALYVLQN